MKAPNRGNPAIILPVENEWGERELTRRALEGNKIHFELRRVAVPR